MGLGTGVRRGTARRMVGSIVDCIPFGNCLLHLAVTQFNNPDLVGLLVVIVSFARYYLIGTALSYPGWVLCVLLPKACFPRSLLPVITLLGQGCPIQLK